MNGSLRACAVPAEVYKQGQRPGGDHMTGVCVGGGGELGGLGALPGAAPAQPRGGAGLGGARGGGDGGGPGGGRGSPRAARGSRPDARCCKYLPYVMGVCSAAGGYVV